MDPTPVSLSWLDLAQLALGTGFVTAFLNQGVGWLREWRRESAATKREATYAALRIAVVLERFAIDCAELTSNSETYRDTGSQMGRTYEALPVLQVYPTDVDWKSLRPKLSARALGLRNELRLSKDAMSFWDDVAPENRSDECEAQAGLRGYQAWRLALDLRMEYRLPTFDASHGNWNPVEKLRTVHDKAVGKELGAIDRQWEREAAEIDSRGREGL